MTEIKEHKRDDATDYTKILKALIEIPFPVGKRLLADFLNGNYKNKSITKNRLDERPSFDSLQWSQEKITEWTERLLSHKMIEHTSADYNKFAKLLKLTMKGRTEIFRPTLHKQEKMLNKKTEITEEDKTNFKKHKNFLETFNPQQKKAIMVKKKEAPVGVKIISVLYYIGAVILVLGGLLSLIIPGLFRDLPFMSALAGPVFVAFGIFAMIFGVLVYFLAKGLWELKPWARIAAIVLSVLGILDGLGGIGIGVYAAGIGEIIVDIVIAVYLTFSKDVKKAFA